MERLTKWKLQVWAGSQDNLDGIYDIYAPSTLSRPSRPRQVTQPVAVPPPPAKEKKKKNKMHSKSLAGSREDLYHPMMNGKVCYYKYIDSFTNIW